MCPKCGKSFKRLKSHLPHCKASKSSKTTSPRNEEATVSCQSSGPLPRPNHSPHFTKGTEFTQSNDQTSKLSINPAVTKKTKKKVSEKIKTALETSSPATDASSPPSKMSKKKIKVSSQLDDEVIKDNLEKVHFLPKKKSIDQTTLTDKDVTEKVETSLDQVSLNPTERKKTKSTTDNLQNSKLKNALTKKEKEKKTVVNQDKSSIINRINTMKNDNNWLENETNFSSRHEPKITVHDVRTSLGRSKKNGGHKTSNMVDQFPTDESNSDVVKSNYSPSALAILQPEVTSHVTTLSPEKSQVMTLTGNNFLGDLSKMENKDCNFTQRADILKEGLQMDCHTMGLTALSSPRRTFLEAEVSVKSFQKGAVSPLKPNVQVAKREMKEIRMDPNNPNGAQRITRELLSQRRLGQVTLRELPDWVMSHSPGHPRDVVEMVRGGWQWYYRKYIDVKKGGVGGVAMLLAGYCVLSYVWCYPHLKQQRWRKYH